MTPFFVMSYTLTHNLFMCADLDSASRPEILAHMCQPPPLGVSVVSAKMISVLFWIFLSIQQFARSPLLDLGTVLSLKSDFKESPET